ncbi:efflux RND transporter periplasmic adaptor subunit [Brumimicrobium mesophilum]|uniref:efflux RND transporter periplasmic adaptor subunit n=1 Tax=Brumimicrobium mesophilum TaxID=392717 RepID=UPI000D143671|nr:efflux RND transporter periplasmic adaptor subunit [Brumimicrobium mesophilum]
MKIKTLLFSIPLLILISCGEEPGLKNATGEIDYTNVDYYVAKVQPFEEIITIPGKTMPFEQVMIYSEVSGRVKKIHFEEGNLIKKGQLLVTVDTDILQAERSKLNVDLALAKKDQSRKKSLFESEAGTEEAFEQAESSVNSLKAQIQSLDVQIAKGRITAPFEGTVGLREISEGAFITSSDLITVLAQNNQLKVDFSIAQRYAHKVKNGQKVSLRPPSDSISSTPVQATVYAISPIINQNTQMLNVRAKVESSENIVAGGFVNVDFNLGESPNSITVPTSAIVSVIDGQIVWVFENGKAAQRKVNIGNRSNKNVQIFGEVEPNDSIVLTGLLGMRVGADIKAKNEIK